MSTNKLMSYLDYTFSLMCVAHSKKLKDLKDYLNCRIYYIVNEGHWIINNRLYYTSHINYALVYIVKKKYNRTIVKLILHPNCMLTDDDIHRIEFPCKVVRGDRYTKIKTDHVDAFIEFLDNNNDWLNDVASLNNFIEY